MSQHDPLDDSYSSADGILYTIVYALAVTLSVATMCGLAGYIWVRWLA